MRDFFNDLKKNILCKRTRNKMLSAYLSNEYFGFDDNLHASSCIKCQVSGKSCLLYTSPSPRDATLSRMPSSA